MFCKILLCPSWQHVNPVTETVQDVEGTCCDWCISTLNIASLHMCFQSSTRLMRNIVKPRNLCFTRSNLWMQPKQLLWERWRCNWSQYHNQTVHEVFDQARSDRLRIVDYEVEVLTRQGQIGLESRIMKLCFKS